MSIWIRKDINCDKFKRSIIDGFAAIKTAFGEDFDNRDFLIAEAYEAHCPQWSKAEAVLTASLLHLIC